jgi:hypothetical protein
LALDFFWQMGFITGVMLKRTRNSLCRAALIDPADCGLEASQLSNVRRGAYFGLRGETWETRRLTRRSDRQLAKAVGCSACGEIVGSNPIEARHFRCSNGLSATRIGESRMLGWPHRLDCLDKSSARPLDRGHSAQNRGVSSKAIDCPAPILS